MKNEFSYLVEPLKELLSMKEDIKKLIDTNERAEGISLRSEKFHGKVVPISFRTYQGVADDFRAFAAGIKGIKNQDLVAQALVEFIQRNQHLSTPPISLVLGEDLCELEESKHSFSKIIKEIREQIAKKKSRAAPQVRIYDSKLIGPKNFVLKVDDGREFNGALDKSFNKLKLQLHELMLEKANG
jgi:hypothetical protein